MSVYKKTETQAILKSIPPATSDVKVPGNSVFYSVEKQRLIYGDDFFDREPLAASSGNSTRFDSRQVGCWFKNLNHLVNVNRLLDRFARGKAYVYFDRVAIIC